MAQDADKKIALNKAKALDRELERFMDAVVGRKPQGDVWMKV